MSFARHSRSSSTSFCCKFQIPSSKSQAKSNHSSPKNSPMVRSTLHGLVLHFETWDLESAAPAMSCCAFESFRFPQSAIRNPQLAAPRRQEQEYMNILDTCPRFCAKKIHA